MVDQIDDIARQARQGSVAAIIQILNEKLAGAGVRTRAVFADGILQLLCEARKIDQLEKSHLVERVRQILEAISPRNIRRVNINGRIAREHQLLWLEDISRDPKNQLLWSQQIVLKKPHLLKRLATARQDRLRQPYKLTLPKTAVPHRVREQQQFQRGILGGLSLGLVLVLTGGVIHSWLSDAETDSSQAADTTSVPAIPATVPVKPLPSPSATPAPDPFAQAVRLAQQAADNGKTAQSYEDWLAIATKWQQASELMASVTPQHPRYQTALNRTALYQQYSEDAQREAEKR